MRRALISFDSNLQPTMADKGKKGKDVRADVPLRPKDDKQPKRDASPLLRRLSLFKRLDRKSQTYFDLQRATHVPVPRLASCASQEGVEGRHIRGGGARAVGAGWHSHIWLVVRTGAQGHEFAPVQLAQPTWCDHCDDFVWGLLKPCVQCKRLALAALVLAPHRARQTASSRATKRAPGACCSTAWL